MACGSPGTPGPSPSVQQTSAQPSSTPPAPTSTAPAAVVPNVVGLNHQLAQDTMQAAGFYYLTEEDATGQGRLLINDRNWVVVTQEPKGGTRAPADTKIILRSKKIGE
ncbi:PASTA domain-containing protein [Kribbella pratensis]|uniref:PASTA domain-containing protein n=1 Tax=Kribbella pratensis TaxID=2512112 RepID=A0ABY2F929_9ACTN|nr:PASTA domain-containing protein [Kribbella pratensis]